MVLFRNQLLDRNVSDIINLHEYAAEFVGKPISVFDSVKIAKAILELNLLQINYIGKLTYEYGLEEDKYPDAKYFVIDKLKNAKTQKIQPKDVVWFWTHWSFISQRINV
jgi:glyceraldehyde 3-phosphate dehydrogenase